MENYGDNECVIVLTMAEAAVVKGALAKHANNLQAEHLKMRNALADLRLAGVDEDSARYKTAVIREELTNSRCTSFAPLFLKVLRQVVMAQARTEVVMADPGM